MVNRFPSLVTEIALLPCVQSMAQTAIPGGALTCGGPLRSLGGRRCRVGGRRAGWGSGMGLGRSHEARGQLPKEALHFKTLNFFFYLSCSLIYEGRP